MVARVLLQPPDDTFESTLALATCEGGVSRLRNAPPRARSLNSTCPGHSGGGPTDECSGLVTAVTGRSSLRVVQFAKPPVDGGRRPGACPWVRGKTGRTGGVGRLCPTAKLAPRPGPVAEAWQWPSLANSPRTGSRTGPLAAVNLRVNPLPGVHTPGSRGHAVTGGRRHVVARLGAPTAGALPAGFPVLGPGLAPDLADKRPCPYLAGPLL